MHTNNALSKFITQIYNYQTTTKDILTKKVNSLHSLKAAVLATSFFATNPPTPSKASAFLFSATILKGAGIACLLGLTAYLTYKNTNSPVINETGLITSGLDHSLFSTNIPELNITQILPTPLSDESPEMNLDNFNLSDPFSSSFSILQAAEDTLVKHDIPEYFVGPNSLGLGNANAPSDLIKKPVEWSGRYQTTTLPTSFKQFVDWATAPERQRFEFQYTPAGWKPKLTANFDFETMVNQETLQFTNRHAFFQSEVAVYGGLNVQTYIQMPFDRNIEKALLSLIDGNLVLWQKNLDGQETLTLKNLDEKLSAFNLFTDYVHIGVEANQLVLPLQKIS